MRVQLRAHGASLPARLRYSAEGALRLAFSEPAHGVAIGQAAVVYDPSDRVCLGGGRITAAERPARLPVLADAGAR